MIMEDKNFIELKLLINEVFGVHNINTYTHINMLNSLSEDNDYFINSLETKFNIDMSTFKYYKYFEEDEFIVVTIFRRIFLKKTKKKILTVSHLLQVITKGKWFDPICPELIN
jgi:hypothetical protein